MEFALNEQQRDFAASIDAALGAADLPGVVRAWAAGDVAPGRKVWQQLANLGVTALGVAEKFDGLGASPVDLVVALERLGRWCVPGPVTESIAVAPILLAHDDQAERSHGLASGELIATVAMPPRVPRAVDADTAGLVLLAGDGSVTEGTPGDCHRSVDPSRRLYEVAASGQAWRAPKDVVARAYEFGALATAAQLVGAGQALLEAAVNYAKQRTQFGRAIGSYQAIKHKLADVHIAIELACPLVYGAAVSLEPRDVSAAKAAASEAALLAARWALQTHGAIGFTCEHDLSLWLLRVQALHSAWGTPQEHRRRVLERYDPPEERQMLRETVASLVAKHAGPAAVRAAMASDRGYDESLWRLLCEQVGAAALVIPEELGGAGGELADAAIVVQELGRALVPSPLLGTTLAELALLAAAKPDAQALTELAQGSAIGALVLDPDYVVNGDIADIVVAATSGQLTRWTRFSAQPVATMDPTRRLARLQSEETEPLCPDPGIADTAAILLAAEQIGAAERCLQLTVEYAKSRVQFGRPIGSFQALKHRMADLYVTIAAARAVVADACHAPTPTNAATARLAASEALSTAAAEGIQLHGGIAITWEHDMHLYFKRAHGSAQLLESPREVLRRLESEVWESP